MPRPKEGGLGVREPRHPNRPSLSGGAEAVPPPPEPEEEAEAKGRPLVSVAK